MHFKAVLFDLFDTLLLLENTEAYFNLCLGRVYEFILSQAINVPYEAFSKTYFTVRDEMIAESLKTLKEPHFNLRISKIMQRLGFNLEEKDPIVTGATKAFADEFKRHTRPDPEAIDVLQRLQQKYKLGLVSNFSIPECGYELLDEFGLKQYLNAVVISGAINRRKPSPEIFTTALKALGVKALETVFVGDSLDLDIQGPQKVGMKAILIERRSASKNDFIKPDAVIKKLNELPKVIATL